MSDQTRRHVDLFWELLDEILNAVLFVLLGLEIVLVPFSGSVAGAALLALAVTWRRAGVSVGLPAAVLTRLVRAAGRGLERC